MLLGRFRVREKLALLVLLPLTAVVLATVPFVDGRLQAVHKASRSATVVSGAVEVGTLIQELQQERLISLGYLATGTDRDRLVVRSSRVSDVAAEVRADVGNRVSPVLMPALDQLAGLVAVRTRVLERSVDARAAYDAFTTAIGDLVDGLGLLEDADLATERGRQELALDAIIRHDEATAAGGAALVIGYAEGGITPRVLGLVAAANAVEDREERIFLPVASPATRTLYNLVEQGPSRRSEQRFLDRVLNDPSSLLGVRPDISLLPAVESVTALSRLVQIKIAADAARHASEAARRAGSTAAIVIVLALLLLITVVVLSIVVARAIAAPLRRLTASAEEVAEVAQAELVRVTDEENAQVATPHLVPVAVHTADELGELAMAFNRVQQVAADLVERQVVSRRNVATMFGNVGRRTQNLVGRQLAMIDALERNEQDPSLLERLYRLDHVSTRLRRNANSLVVLSGSVEPGVVSSPLSIADTIRSALGEIEGFQRVRLGRLDDLLLGPDVSSDVILLLAELLENSTSFSPPHTEVEVSARAVPAGCMVTVVDHGIGMTDEQLAEENARLVERERLDLAPTDVLGLFVVGRLARRHGIEVVLRPSEGTGVTAEVLIPGRYLVRAESSAAASGGKPAERRPEGPADRGQPAGAVAGRDDDVRAARAEQALPAAHWDSGSGWSDQDSAESRPLVLDTAADPVETGGPNGRTDAAAARSLFEPRRPPDPRAAPLVPPPPVVSFPAGLTEAPARGRDPVVDGFRPVGGPAGQALIREFEHGVRRALENLAAVTARRVDRPGAIDQMRPLDGDPFDGQPSGAQPSDRRPFDGQAFQAQPSADDVARNGSVVPAQGVPAQGVPAQGVPAQGVPAQGVPAQGVPAPADPGQADPGQADPGQAGPERGLPAQRLNRRVPGAQLPDVGDRPSPAGAEAVGGVRGRAGRGLAGIGAEPGSGAGQLWGPSPDPDAARALVEEFESGVARAQRSVEGSDRSVPTTEREER